MTFNNLSQHPNCNCLEGAYENNVSKFALKTNRPSLIPNDFKTKWENGQNGVNTCEEICGKKGKSLSIIEDNDKNLDEVLIIFKALFKLAPGYKPHCTIITLGNKSGLVKSTPSKANKYHHDFYKSDNFDISLINFIESTPLAV